MKMLIIKLMLALLFIPLVTGSAMGPQPEELTGPQLCYSERPSSHLELEELFSSHNYGWGTLDDGIPSIFLEALPSDLDRIPQVQKKKIVFFLSLLPVVLRANEEIREHKTTLTDLLRRYDQGETLTGNELARLSAITTEYRVSGDPLEDLQTRETLLMRVDTLPTSLVLAQAATESAYGTSRFARLGNNLFGEWTFTPGTGMVPLDRPEGRTYELRCFSSIYESVASYMNNLNTHRAYTSLREQRARMRAEGRPLQGIVLAAGLTRYSERGEDYVKQIRTIIRSNRLHRLGSILFRQNRAAETEETAPFSAGLLSSAAPSSRLSALRKNP
ncbi:glucosaminidase domain-containing protein [Trichloromonas sp.]|uniref:glucosaminidase domain-containing protein n=1 Tax=Trichloromonas sp. TaxID=3069249 RepID=UPI003D81B5BA